MDDVAECCRSRRLILASSVTSMHSGIVQLGLWQRATGRHSFLVALKEGKHDGYQLASHPPDYLVAADILVLAFINGAFSGHKTLVERGKLIVSRAHGLPDCQIDGLLEDTHTTWRKLGMIERPAGLRQGWCPSTVRFELRCVRSRTSSSRWWIIL
jgi:hypothetical protein